MLFTAGYAAYFCSLFLLTILPLSSPQDSNVTCLPGFEWSSNSRAQDPCIVASYLTSPCITAGHDFHVLSLPSPHVEYAPPFPNNSECACSTVLYSMYAACANCQGNHALSWSKWQNSCPQVFVKEYHKAIPAGTAVPAWAFLDIVTHDGFNATAAEIESAEGKPDITALSSVATPTSSSTWSFSTIIASSSALNRTANSTTISSNNVSDTNEATPTSSGIWSFPTDIASSSAPKRTATSTTVSSNSMSGPNEKETEAGTIVSGVVGVLTVVVLGTAAVFWYRRYRCSQKPSHIPEALELRPPFELGLKPYSTTGRKLYNPDDPSTFPDAQYAAPTSAGDKGSCHEIAVGEQKPLYHNCGGIAEI